MHGDQTDPLFARADRAIRESHRLRAEVRNGLDRATKASARLVQSLESLHPRPCAPSAFQVPEPWSTARLRAGRPAEVIQREDAASEDAWRRARLLIETPLNLFRS